LLNWTLTIINAYGIGPSWKVVIETNSKLPFNLKIEPRIRFIFLEKKQKTNPIQSLENIENRPTGGSS